MKTEAEQLNEQIANLINHGLSNGEINDYLLERFIQPSKIQLIGCIRILLTRPTDNPDG